MRNPRTSSAFGRTPLQSMVREIAPVLLLAGGALAGIGWSLVIGGRLTTTPPFLFTSAVLTGLAFYLAMRGAPRWSYPWIALGIVGSQAILWTLLLSGRDTPATGATVGIAGLAGPILAAVVGGSIATRNWSDSALFVGLYLAAASLALPIVLLPPEAGARVDIELPRALLTILQAALTGAAILLWNRSAVMAGLGLLALVVLVSGIAAGVLVPGSRADVPDELNTFFGAAQGPFRIALLMILVTFAIGGVRRFFSGSGLLAPPIPEPDDEDEDEDDTDHDRESGEPGPLIPPPRPRATGGGTGGAQDGGGGTPQSGPQDQDTGTRPERPRVTRRRRRRGRR